MDCSQISERFLSSTPAYLEVTSLGWPLASPESLLRVPSPVPSLLDVEVWLSSEEL